MNLSIPRVYNAIEILLLSAVMDEYFNKELDLKKFKTQQGEMNRAIRDYFDNNSLGRYESKNNRHILKYLGHKSAEINNFLNQNVRVDLNVNWQQFFEFISILRNVVTHNGMMMSKDVINQINSNAESLYGKYFSDSILKEDLVLLSPIQDLFLNVLNMTNEFALNMVKFIKNKPNLGFASFEPALKH